MKKKKPSGPKPPAGIGAASVSFWLEIQCEYAIRDSGGLRLLECATLAHDRMLKARAHLERDGLATKDKWKQIKPHPLLAAERDARGQVIQALRALSLDFEASTKGGSHAI
jgi:phage terminase small subunit